MPNNTQITNRIIRGRLLQANLAKSYAQQENVGNDFNFWDKAVYVSNLVQGLQFQQSISDYTSSITLSIYNKLGGILGGLYIDGAAIDPNAQIPGQTVVTIPVLLGYNSDKLPFETTIDSPQLVLSNYDTLYAPLYGNNPILAIYDNQGQYIGDEQTPPIIEYLDNDPSKKILSITWDYGVATSGYIQISGVSPSAATGNPTNNNSAVELPFSQDDLLDAGGGNWYLPLVLASNKVPIYTQVNGISVSTTYDKSNVPARLYGFANNEAQSIIVTVI